MYNIHSFSPLTTKASAIGIKAHALPNSVIKFLYLSALRTDFLLAAKLFFILIYAPARALITAELKNKPGSKFIGW